MRPSLAIAHSLFPRNPFSTSNRGLFARGLRSVRLLQYHNHFTDRRKLEPNGPTENRDRARTFWTGCYGCRLWTSNDVSCGGVVNPPFMPFCIRGIRMPSRNRSQLSLESWTATIVQPPAEGPAA